MSKCHACLALDRNLLFCHSEELKVLYSYLLGDIKCLDSENLRCPVLCWECSQKLINVKKFQENIIQAHKILKYCDDKSLDMKNYYCLSNLSVCVKTEFDFEFEEKVVYSQTDFTFDEIKSNIAKDDFKLEVDADKDSLNTDSDNFDSFSVNDEINSKKEEKEVIEDVKRSDKKSSKKQKVRKVPNKKILEADMEKYKCIKLDEEGMLKFRKELKRNLNYRRSAYKCKSCIISFSTEEGYRDHKRRKHKEIKGKYACRVCKVRFEKMSLLKIHKQKHYYKYQCTICDKEFPGHVGAKDHFRVHSKMLQCKNCPLAFGRNLEVRQHFQFMHSQVFCDYCGHKSTSKKSLVTHLMSKHGLKALQCEQCGKRFQSAKNLKNHKYRFHVVEPRDDAYCVECNKTFRNKFCYTQHLKLTMKHNGQSKRAVKREKPKCFCPECGKMYCSKRAVRDHVELVHLKKSRNHCQQCDRGFFSSSGLKLHIQSVHLKIQLPKNQICQYCQRGFSTKKILRHHIRTHTGEKPFVCTECPAAFAQSTALKTHFKTQHLNPRKRIK